jgi:hypothetical protein
VTLSDTSFWQLFFRTDRVNHLFKL